MARIDALYMEDPCSGSRRMVGYLARDEIPISRDRVRNLMRRMGIRAIYQKPRTGDFQERCHSFAAFQTTWINGSA
jgi:putative transposase